MSRILQIIVTAGALAAWPAEKIGRPEVPENLKAPAGEEVVLSAHAKGVQIYVCQPGADQKLAWTLNGPDAELLDAAGKTIGHHSIGPTWKHVDGSEVTGKVVAKQDAPKPDAIPWLLLTAVSHKGEGLFSKVTSIQRIHTQGGLFPAANTCDASANGKEVRSGYEADFYFYAP